MTGPRDYGKDLNKAKETKERLCLKCDKLFLSTGKGNCICTECSKENKKTEKCMSNKTGKIKTFPSAANKLAKASWEG